MEVSNNIQNSKNQFQVQKTSPVSFQARLSLPKTPKDIFIYSNSNKQNLVKSFWGIIGLGGIIGTQKANSSKHLEKIFKELYDFKGDNVDFAQLAFKKIKKHLGLNGALSIKMIVTDVPTDTAAAAFDWRTGIFSIDKPYCQESTKDDILNSVRHELEHYLQYEGIIRTENIGLEKFLKLNAEKDLNGYKEDFFEARMPKEYYRTDEKFIDDTNKTIYKQFWQRVIKKRGIIKVGTPEAQQASKNLNASLIYPRKSDYVKNYCSRNNIPYEVPHRFDSMYKTDKYHYQYITNPLEIGARHAGENLQEQYLDWKLKMTKIPHSINEELIEVQKFKQLQIDSMEQFENAFEKKFAGYTLPENFKGYMYFKAMIKDSESNPDILSNIKAIPQNMHEMDRGSILNSLELYEFMLQGGHVNLRSQEEIDNVTKFIQEYRARS